MESLITTIGKLYTDQLPFATSTAAELEKYVRVFAAAGAFIYIFGRVIMQIANNQDIEFFGLLRPFVLMMIIPIAPDICNGIDDLGRTIQSTANAGTLDIADRVAVMNERIQDKIDKKWETIRTDPEKYKDIFGETQEESKIMNMDFMVDFKIGFEKVSESIKFQILAVVQQILLALMYVAESILLLLSIAFRLVLRIGFPIALALAIFPGFTSNLANWFGRYINFALLPAVAAIYSRLVFSIVEDYIKRYDVPEALDGMGAELQQPEFLGVAFIALMVMALIGYLQVPSMTSMLISVGGVGSMTQAVSRGAQQSAGVAKGGVRMAGAIAAPGARGTGAVVRGAGSAALTTAKMGLGASIMAGKAAGRGASRAGSAMAVKFRSNNNSSKT